MGVNSHLLTGMILQVPSPKKKHLATKTLPSPPKKLSSNHHFVGAWQCLVPFLGEKKTFRRGSFSSGRLTGQPLVCRGCQGLTRAFRLSEKNSETTILVAGSSLSIWKKHVLNMGSSSPISWDIKSKIVDTTQQMSHAHLSQQKQSSTPNHKKCLVSATDFFIGDSACIWKN